MAGLGALLMSDSLADLVGRRVAIEPDAAVNEVTASAPSQERRARWTLSARGRREPVLFGAVYGIYLAGRWLSAGDLGVAREHARWVLGVERSLHIAIEGSRRRSRCGRAGQRSWRSCGGP